MSGLSSPFMVECVFAGCDQPGAETLTVRYTPDGMEEVEGVMNLCLPHFRYLVDESMRGLSAGSVPEEFLRQADPAAAFLAWARAGGEPETEWVITRSEAAIIAHRLQVAEDAIDELATGYPEGAPTDWFVNRAHTARDAGKAL